MTARTGGRETDDSSPLQGQADSQAGIHCLHLCLIQAAQPFQGAGLGNGQDDTAQHHRVSIQARCSRSKAVVGWVIPGWHLAGDGRHDQVGTEAVAHVILDDQSWTWFTLAEIGDEWKGNEDDVPSM